MGENTSIEWAHHTFNPWIGCTAVSPACDHCYAERFAKRLGVAWGPRAARRETATSTWEQPMAWDRKAAREGRRARVFCASLADVFDNQVPEDWRLALWALIASTPNLDWLLLTKRPQNIAKMLPTTIFWGGGRDLVWPWPNVWLGTTVENQAEADRRIPHLLAVPAAKRFLSCEPLLGPVDLTRVCIVPQVSGSIRAGIHLDTLDGSYCESGMPYVGEWDINRPFPTDAAARRIDWVICGGESGPGARPMHPDWARSLRDQCDAAGVPFHFKQWGEWLGFDHRSPCITIDGLDGGLCVYTDGKKLKRNDVIGWTAAGDHRLTQVFARIGKKAAGRLLDGVQHDGVPA